MKLTAVKKIWFLLTSCLNISIAWAILKFINLLPNFIMSPARKRGISSYICCFLSRCIFYLNPQINIKSFDDWNILDKGSFVILINHTSQLDPLLFNAMCPLQYASKIRVLAKAELFQLPVLGTLLTNCGHFPVHFLRSEVGHFSVDKQKQAKVIEDIKQHISTGGHLAFFPEGQINRSNPLILQSFRHGLFKIFSEIEVSRSSQLKSISMYAFLHTGLEKSWHPKAKLGGDSAEINCKLMPVLFSKGAHVSEIQSAVQQGLDSFATKTQSARNALSKL